MNTLPSRLAPPAVGLRLAQHDQVGRLASDGRRKDLPQREEIVSERRRLFGEWIRVSTAALVGGVKSSSCTGTKLLRKFKRVAYTLLSKRDCSWLPWSSQRRVLLRDVALRTLNNTPMLGRSSDLVGCFKKGKGPWIKNIASSFLYESVKLSVWNKQLCFPQRARYHGVLQVTSPSTSIVTLFSSINSIDHFVAPGRAWTHLALHFNFSVG